MRGLYVATLLVDPQSAGAMLAPLLASLADSHPHVETFGFPRFAAPPSLRLAETRVCKIRMYCTAILSCIRKISFIGW